MDGFGSEMLYSGVASPLRLPLRALLRGAAVAAVLDEGVGALGGDRVHRVPGPKGRVRLAVRHVGPEAALLEHDRLAADRVVAQLLEGRSGRPAAARLGLAELREGLFQADREELLLPVQRPGLLALLHVRPIAPVGGHDLLALGLAEGAGERQ